MSLLPSEPDTAAADDAEPRVVGVESDDADQLLSALSSTTARRLLAELHDEPAPPADLAGRVDTSLQNAQYHLQNLEDAGAVEIVDTAYSEKGREMDVYAPADRPLVIFAGDEDNSTSIRTALTRLLGGFAGLAFVSVLVEGTFGDGFAGLFDGVDAGDGAAATPTVSEAAAARTATPETAEAAATGAGVASLPPGLLFFLGGATALVATFAIWYVQ